MTESTPDPTNTEAQTIPPPAPGQTEAPAATEEELDLPSTPGHVDEADTAAAQAPSEVPYDPRTDPESDQYDPSVEYDEDLDDPDDETTGFEDEGDDGLGEDAPDLEPSKPGDDDE
jgi:hypothetical protein